jgi:enoyl-CoA hydratase
MAGQVRVEVDGAVATLFLDNPEKMNAFDKPMWRGLIGALGEVSADPGLRVVVVRGAGGRAFSPGADISEFPLERGTPEQAAIYGELMDEGLSALRDCPLPTVAAIEGPCCGIGLVTALACDLRIAAESARFGVPVSRIGINMPAPEMIVLHEAVGAAAALEILLEGEVFGSARALGLRLITRIAADDALEEAVAAACRHISAGAPSAARVHKKMIRALAAGRGLSAEDVAEAYGCFGSEDFAEGYRAFLDKRRPVFSGR